MLNLLEIVQISVALPLAKAHVVLQEVRSVLLRLKVHEAVEDEQLDDALVLLRVEALLRAQRDVLLLLQILDDGRGGGSVLLAMKLELHPRNKDVVGEVREGGVVRHEQVVHDGVAVHLEEALHGEHDGSLARTFVRAEVLVRVQEGARRSLRPLDRTFGRRHGRHGHKVTQDPQCALQAPTQFPLHEVVLSLIQAP